MKKISTFALAFATTALLAGPIAAPAFAAKKDKAAAAASDFKPELSKEFRVPMGAAQQAMTAKDTATALAKLSEAEALAKLPDEKFYVGQMELQISQANGDKALQMKGINDVLNSGSTAAVQDRPRYLFYAGSGAYDAKDYQAAIKQLSESESLGYTNPNLLPLLAESNFKLNQVPAGLAVLERAIKAQQAGGQKAPEDWYKRGASVAYQAKLMPEVAKWTRLQVAAYPTAENWRSALVIYRDTGALDNQATLDLYRLMRASKAITSERDYFEYANLANDRGLPGEAVSVIDEGAAAGKLNKTAPGIADIYKIAAPKVAADKASLPASEKAAASAKDGKSAMSTGDALLGYGEYARAAEMYKLALSKGNVDANVVNTRLGIALALGGQKDAAKAALGAVTGARTDLAQFWVQWLAQPAA
ncbi:MAG: hypothetical protein DI623_11770 [Sphingomonas sanxanigenens]|uniref:Tetratricopeptide repeat protein n=1 Tax=Sphingomonas sanxanigenens TaxID=397260 RepID=A0A2W5C0R3_9SPHN|nr:MAG: hypothetical protein DI623_11770 [Sphingomonas sanxanigenens]